MTRREFYRLIEELRCAAAEKLTSAHEVHAAVLDGFRAAMFQRRGRDAISAGGQSHFARFPSPGTPGEGAGPPYTTNLMGAGGPVPIPVLLLRDDAQSLLDQDDLLGQVYQALNAPALEAAYRSSARDRRKFSADDIPAVSQLFTPRWVVEFLLHNTLGRLWVQWHPMTRLRNSFHWMGETNGAGPCRLGPTAGPPQERNETTAIDLPGATLKRALDIRFLDPACGTMNFGLVAFEMLCGMYREERDRAGEQGWPAEPSVGSDDDIASAVLRHNLFGIDIDPVALRLARASLEIKSGISLSDGQCNLWQADALFDPTIASKCEGTFDVVATNPPYISSRNLPVDQVARMKKRFRSAWRDLYACFIERSFDFAREGGRIGLLAMQSFMFTGSYERLRARITDRSAIEFLAHFGPGLFGVGNPGTLQTVALVAQKDADAQRREARSCTAYRLVDVDDEEKENQLREAMDRDSPPASDASETHDEESPSDSPCRLRFRASTNSAHAATVFHFPQSTLMDLPRRTWAYWIDAPLHRAFKTFPRLGDIAPPRQGLATTDNFRFVRYWWEVTPTHRDAPAKATARRWTPYAKGGQFRRWYESPRHRVNWEDDGREIKQAIVDRYPYLKGEWQWVAKNTSYYGGGGVSWSYLTSGRFSARRLETGAIFDVAGSSLFPEDVPGMLALLNSSAIHRLLQAINPTVNFQVGDLAELPIPREIPPELAALAESAIRIQQDLDACDEASPDFALPFPWADAVDRVRSIQQELAAIQQQIDLIVCELYGLHDNDQHTDERPALDAVDLSRRWISFGVGKLLGRWDGSPPGRVLRFNPPDPHVIRDVREILQARIGEAAASEIEAHVGGIDSFLMKDFYPWHVRVYRRRPPYWALGSNVEFYLMPHDFAIDSQLKPILHKMGETLPDGWNRCVDDGIAVGLASLRALVPDPALRRVLDQVAADREDGRFPWMRSVF